MSSWQDNSYLQITLLLISLIKSSKCGSTNVSQADLVDSLKRAYNRYRRCEYLYINYQGYYWSCTRIFWKAPIKGKMEEIMASDNLHNMWIRIKVMIGMTMMAMKSIIIMLMRMICNRLCCLNHIASRNHNWMGILWIILIPLTFLSLAMGKCRRCSYQQYCNSSNSSCQGNCPKNNSCSRCSHWRISTFLVQ